jgi:NPCBM/NEW2 domain
MSKMLTPTVALILICSAAPTAAAEIRTLEGAPIVADLKEVATDGSITLADGRKISAGDWYSLRKGLLPPWPRTPHVELTNGDRIAGTVVDSDDDALRFRHPGGTTPPTIRLPLSALRVLWLTYRPGDAADPDWLAGPRKLDVLQARNGDIVRGAIAAIDAAKNALRYQLNGKDHQLELSKLFAIGFNTDLARLRRPKGPYYRLTLVDGSRLSVISVAFDGQIWTAVTPFKDTVRIGADQLVSVDVEQGKASYLSDLKPAKYQYQPFDKDDYSWVADRAVTGRPMVVKTSGGESTFDRGIGLHAGCSLTYSLAGKYRRFEALAAMDAASGVRGDAVLAIMIDGKELPLPGGGRLTYAHGPLPLRIDVSGAKELTIVLRRGSAGNVQDHVDLAEARLVP